MTDAVVYKSDQIVRHSGAPPVLVQRGQPDAVTTVERRIFLQKNENLSTTHRTVVEIRTSLDTFEKTRVPEERRVEQGAAPALPALQYRMFDKTRAPEETRGEQGRTPLVPAVQNHMLEKARAPEETRDEQGRAPVLPALQNHMFEKTRVPEETKVEQGRAPVLPALQYHMFDKETRTEQKRASLLSALQNNMHEKIRVSEETRGERGRAPFLPALRYHMFEKTRGSEETRGEQKRAPAPTSLQYFVLESHFARPRIPEETRVEQGRAPVLAALQNHMFGKTKEETKVEQKQAPAQPAQQYRVVPKVKEVEVPEVQVEYDDTYVEVPVPFELPIIAPRQVPVEQVVQRNIPKAINVHTKQRFQMPRIQPKYYDVKVPIYVPSYIEVPVPSHFVALKTGESFPKQLQVGPAIPHLPSCPVIPDRKGSERYMAAIKGAKPAFIGEDQHQEDEQGDAEKISPVSTTGLPMLHRRGSQGSDLGYSSSALVQGAYPSVEFVAVSPKTARNDSPPPSARDETVELQVKQLLEKRENEHVLADEEEQSNMEREPSGVDTASDYLGDKMNEFNPSEAGGATPALSASPALVHAAA